MSIDIDKCRANLSIYTRRAYQSLPDLDKPRILDIACGTGVPTILLAELSDGQIVAVDNDRLALKSLRAKIQSAKLTDRIEIIESDIRKLDFPTRSFDIIWAEGALWIVGFENGIGSWKRFLRPAGYLVIHDNYGDIDSKLASLSGHGFAVIELFKLEPEVWWQSYYAPLELEIEKLRGSVESDPALSAKIETIEKEIRQFREDSSRFTSAFIVAQSAP